MEDTVTISSIRLNKTLAKKLELAAQKEGISKTEMIRRSLEAYLPKIIEPRPKTADEVLDLVQKRSGGVPTIKKPVKEIFNEEEQLESR